MKKVTATMAKRVLKKTKERSRRRPDVISFSLAPEALEAFKRACKRHDVKASVAIEEFMIEFAQLG